MRYPETVHCLKNERIQQFVDKTPHNIPPLREAKSLAIGRNLVLVFRDMDTPKKIAVEIHADLEPESPTKGEPTRRLVCANRPNKVRHNILLACEHAFIQSLKASIEGQSFCGHEPDRVFRPLAFTMITLTPGQPPPPPEAINALDMFMNMDFHTLELDQYQVMSLGRYRIGIRRDLDQTTSFVVQLVDSHGDRLLEETSMPESELHDSMRRTAAQAMELTIQNAE